MSIYFFCTLDFRQVYGYAGYPIGTFFFLLSYLVIAYAITRHQLLDAETIAKVVQKEKLMAIGMITAGIHHDLKSPLYVAKGTLETYLEKTEEGLYKTVQDQLAASKKSAETALRQLDRVAEISQRLMAFVKPHAVEDKTQKVILKPIVENVLELANYQVDATKIKILNLVGENIYLYGDRGQIEEILMNLILNACQALKEKGGEIRVAAEIKKESAKRAVSGKEIVILSVSDNGPGISPMNQKHLFEPFYTTTGREGTGLGLYTVKQLVEKMCGRIWFESSAGGTSFFLRLPGGHKNL